MEARLDESVVARIRLFGGMPAAVRRDVAAVLSVARVPKGHQYFRQDDPAATCYAVLDGQVKIVQLTANGGQVLLRFFGPGEMFGTLAVLTGVTYPAAAVAVTETLSVQWSAEDMVRLMETHPMIMAAANRIIGGRFQEVQARVGELQTENVERRIAHAVLRLARQAGRRTADGLEIEIPVTRQEIGELSGATLHTVSRTLSNWETKGWLETGRQRVVLRDEKAIETLAGHQI